MEQEQVECVVHKGNRCGIIVRPKKQELNVISPIFRCTLDFATKTSMWASIYAEIVGKYYLSDKKVVRYAEFSTAVHKEFLYEYYTSKSQIAIKPMTSDRNVPKSSFFTPDNDVRPIMDTVYFEYISRSTGLRIVPVRGKGEVPRLEWLCYEKLRWSNIVFNDVIVDGIPCKRVRYTTNNLSSREYIKLYSEYCRDQVYRGSNYDLLMRLFPQINSIIFRLLDCDRFVKKLHFRYSPIELLGQVKMHTGGGILPLLGKMFEDENFITRNSGKKIFLVMAAIKEIDKYIRALLRGEDYQLNPVGVVRLKGEVRYFLEEEGDDLVRAQWKTREFFITSMLLLFLSLMFGERRKFETGRVIMIGMKWFHGGAYEIALKMNYDNPEIFWASGDVEKFDKSVMDVFIYNYCANNRRYYDRDRMPPRIRALFERMMRDWGYHLTNKVVLFLDDIWRIIMGLVPSGTLETSHLDSYVMLTYFVFWICYIILTHPELSEVILEFLFEGFIRILVYGDDHLWCAPKALRGIINVQNWKIFLKDYCRSVLRDEAEYDSFLSIPDHRTGGMVKYGPKFCKRYFIASNDKELAPVLPYKPLYEPMIRVFVNVNQEPVDYLFSIVGHMWDSMGTNKLHYDLLNLFLDRIKRDLQVKSMYELYLEEVQKPEKRVKLNKLVRKLQMDPKQIFRDFPKYEKIRKRHKYESHRCKFGIDTYGVDDIDLELISLEDLDFE